VSTFRDHVSLNELRSFAHFDTIDTIAFDGAENRSVEFEVPPRRRKKWGEDLSSKIFDGDFGVGSLPVRSYELLRLACETCCKTTIVLPSLHLLPAAVEIQGLLTDDRQD